MREILIEQARHKGSLKHGGRARRRELTEGLAWIEPPSGDLLALDEAIQHVKAAMRQVHAATPDIIFTIEDVVESGDTIWVRVTARGTKGRQSINEVRMRFRASYVP